MKIEIEFKSSAEAKLTIDGKEMQVTFKDGVTELKGIERTERESTLGGIVAEAVYPQIRDLQLAWTAAVVAEPGSNTWDTLSEVAAEEAQEAVW